MPGKQTKPDEQHTPEVKLRRTYSSLFHEIQFRATKNALMNYHQAEIYEDKGTKWKRATAVLSGVSASGVLAGIVQKGKVMANRLGVAGLIGLPVSGVIQLASSSTSELVPSYNERAKKHAVAAAGWMRIAESARTEQLKIRVNPDYTMEQITKRYEELVQKKEEISKEVLIPRDTHRHFHSNPETVYLAMRKRTKTFDEFLDLERKNQSSVAQIQEAEDIYF